MSRQRISSASSSRMGHEGPFGEGMFLREELDKMEYELIHTKAELKKVSDQLNCLIMLVKKAWMGDSGAARHVANIVGVAPPDINDQDIDPDRMIANYITKPKSRALNNWAILTIGLLNRDYKQLEREIEMRQKCHLQQREMLLDQELSSGPHNGGHLLRRPSLDRGHQVSGKKTYVTQPPPSPVNGLHPHDHISGRPPSALKSKQTVKHLYRPPNENKSKPKVSFNNLFIGPSTQSNEEEEQPGLFDPEHVLGPEEMNRRGQHVSARQQRIKDQMRSRPRSAVLPGQLKQQRPLSTKSSGSMHSLGSTSSASSSSIQGVNPDRRRRVKSAAPGLRSRANERENDVPEDLQEASPASNHDDELPMPQKPTGSDRFKVKPLECVTQFTNDMKEMNSMEDDFKRNALELQRKLGISPEGMVY